MPLYGLTVEGAAAAPARKFFGGLVNNQALEKIAGAAGVQVMRDHFTDRERTDAHRSASALGAQPSGLYAEFAGATHFELGPGAVDLVVSHVAIQQRVHGGTIRPTGGRQFLTQPALAMTYGKRASDFAGRLVFAWATDLATQRTGRALVAEDALVKEYGRARKDGTRRTKEVAPSGVYFWLIRSATQAGDPSIIASGEKIAEGIKKQLADHVEVKRLEAGNG